MQDQYYDYSLQFHAEQIAAATKLTLQEARQLLIQGMYLMNMDMQAVTVQVISVELSKQI